jgi:ankyrin repeat protein
MSLWNFAQSGTLTKELVQDHLQKDFNLTVDSKDGSGFTPLAYALWAGHTNIVELLLKNGASVDEKNGDLKTPLYIAVTAQRNEARRVQLIVDKTAQTLEEPVTGSWTDQTPLMAAVAQPNPNPQVIRLLRERGASTGKKNTDGKSAIEITEALHPQRRDDNSRLRSSNYVQPFCCSSCMPRHPS